MAFSSADIEKLAEEVRPRSAEGARELELIADVRGGLGVDLFYTEIPIGEERISFVVEKDTPQEEIERLCEELYKKVREALKRLSMQPIPPLPLPPERDPAAAGAVHLDTASRQWCEKLIEEQYDEAYETVNLVLDPQTETAPTKAHLKAAILKHLTPELIAELKHLREPTLLIVPSLSPERLLGAVNRPECRTMPGQVDSELYDPYPDAVRSTAKTPTKFRFAITEGKQHFKAQTGERDFEWNKPVSMKNQTRMDAFSKYCTQTSMQSLDAASYMMLMMRGLLRKEPVDRISDNDDQFTLLPATLAHFKGSLVAAGDWNSGNRRASFSYDRVGVGSVSARLRASVMAEI